MKLSDTFTFDASRQEVWNLLMDSDAIARALPGVDELVPIEGEDNAWQIIARIGVATVRGTYSGTLRMTEIVPPEQFRLTVWGEGYQSIVDGTALLNFAYDPEAQKTIVNWEAEANLTGKIGGVMQRLITAVAILLSRQFFQGIARQLKSSEPL